MNNVRFDAENSKCISFGTLKHGEEKAITGIVLCKNCLWADKFKHEAEYYCNYMKLYHEGDFYCAKGEAK